MRRYIPRIQVIESDNGVYIDYNLRKEFYFPETEFMAVSQYRNRQVGDFFCVDNGPFTVPLWSAGLFTVLQDWEATVMIQTLLLWKYSVTMLTSFQSVSSQASLSYNSRMNKLRKL